jgi:pimeloyl-ACP methyl ester carboxylesterase
MRRLLFFALLLACSDGERGSRRAAERPEPEPEEAPVPSLPEARVVRLTTGDGVTLVGDLQPANDPGAPLVILVHQLASDRSEWAPLLARLHEVPRVATFAFDLRGHGASTAGASGPIDYHHFTPEDWAATADDVLAALREVTSETYGLAPSRVAVVGSSIGSSAAIAAAAEEPRFVAIVALSPGRAYHGMDALTPTMALSGRRFLGLVARGETENVETAEAMARVTGGETIVVDGDAHGVALFGADPDTLERTVRFLRSALGAEAP